MKIYPLTIAMTPSFWDEGHMLLQAQLNCLSKQTVKDFGVYLVDPHYKKRKDIIPELAEKYKLDIVHIPYEPNPYIAKKLDCAIFNAAYCYSRSPRIVRYSCYRFVTPNFVEKIMSVPELVNIDFYSLNVGPCILEEEQRKNGILNPHKKHEIVWNFESDEVNWDQIPRTNGVDIEGNFLGDPNLSLARWGPLSQIETEIIPVPLNCYGNIMWWRENWFSINGTEEVITNTAHWEDIDFDNRANIAGQQAIRLPGLMYRLYHQHGGFSQRSNTEVDVPCKPACDNCSHFLRYADRLKDRDLRYKLYLERVNTFKEISLYNNDMIWVCKKCNLSGPMWHKDEGDYIEYIKSVGKTKATILSDVKIGRNLRVLSEEMDRYDTIEKKFEIYQDSWSNNKYYGSV